MTPLRHLLSHLYQLTEDYLLAARALMAINSERGTGGSGRSVDSLEKVRVWVGIVRLLLEVSHFSSGRRLMNIGRILTDLCHMIFLRVVLLLFLLTIISLWLFFTVHEIPLIQCEESGQAQSYFSRASLIIHEVKDKEIILAFKLCQVSILYICHTQVSWPPSSFNTELML